ncbi:MAG: STM4011 family radical SAM protein [Myxococcales bacterium]|nr:STM4011 family radical SAM protein [Myxococcales bacterium]
MRLTLNYRGPLSSCNYTCSYCPFAKEWEPEQVLRADREGLARFVDWALAFDGPPLHVLFTPWGEALVRSWYRDAFVTLANAPSVAQIAAQTNLSMPLSWLDATDRTSAALWCTWHPSQTPMARFLQQCDKLDALGLRYSVGVVGLHEHLDAIEQLRAQLPLGVYLWVNAFQRVTDYYTPAQRDRIRAVDPHFDDNRRHDSLGLPCHAGHTHVTVDGEGTVRRCHFVDTPLGNLYDGALNALLKPRTCPNAQCRCHIGYTHLPHLGLYETYGDGLMARIPAHWPRSSTESPSS